MAKSDNLTDFLRGMADKFRLVLESDEPLDPQSFEEKIQAVWDEAYGKGFAEGGPTGITAKAADVLAGKVFGSGGSAKTTGTMLDQSNAIRTITTDTSDRVKGAFQKNGNDIWIAPGNGYWGNWDWSKSRLTIPGSHLASAIGLTAAKLVAGNTVLGVVGTGKGNLGAYYGSSYPGGSNGGTAVDVVSVSSTSRITANSWQKCTVKTAGSYRICAQGEASHWDGDGAWAIRKNGANLKSGVNKMGVINFTVTCAAGDVLELYKMPRFSGSWCVIAY